MKVSKHGTRLSTILAAGLALLPAALGGQTPDAAGRDHPALAIPASVSLGHQIRVTYKAPEEIGDQELRIEGRFMGVAPDRIRLATTSTLHASSPAGAERSIPLDDVLRLETRGESSAGRGAARGALIGGLVGAVVGLLPSAAICSELSCEPGYYLMGSALVGGIGAGVGAAIGAMMGRSEWEEVPLQGSR